MNMNQISALIHTANNQDDDNGIDQQQKRQNKKNKNRKQKQRYYEQKRGFGTDDADSAYQNQRQYDTQYDNYSNDNNSLAQNNKISYIESYSSGNESLSSSQSQYSNSNSNSNYSQRSEESAQYAKPKGEETREILVNQFQKKTNLEGLKYPQLEQMRVEIFTTVKEKVTSYYEGKIAFGRQRIQHRKSRFFDDVINEEKKLVGVDENFLSFQSRKEDSLSSSQNLERLNTRAILLTDTLKLKEEEKNAKVEQEISDKQLLKKLSEATGGKNLTEINTSTDFDPATYRGKISVIHHRQSIQTWLMFVIFTACYSVIVLPLRLGIATKFLDPYYDPIDLLTWIIYVLDFVINLRTTFINIHGFEVTQSRKIVVRYIKSARFWMDFASLLALPSYFTTVFPPELQQALSLLGILKAFRVTRIKTLLIQSRLKKLQKLLGLTLYYLFFLFMYLHICGCLFFQSQYQSYANSTSKIQFYEQLNILQWTLPPNENPTANTYHNNSDFTLNIFQDEREQIRQTLQINEKNPYPAWVPPYDNLDSTENFWLKFEISRMSDEERAILNLQVPTYDPRYSLLTYIWAVSVYYSVLILGGNEMQPTMVNEMQLVILLNIFGLMVLNYIAGEIAGNVTSIAISPIQSSIDEISTVMKHTKLPSTLQQQIVTSFLKYQGTMIQQQELTNFFQVISAPLRIQVQKQMFQGVLSRNQVVKRTIVNIEGNDHLSEIVDRTSNKRYSKSTNVSATGQSGMMGSKVRASFLAVKNSKLLAKTRQNKLISTIVEQLDTYLQVPKSVILTQDEVVSGVDEDEVFLYFVGMGRCEVRVRDQSGKERHIRNLSEGDHFGEVALIYKTRRTASIYSLNYNTYSRMSLGQFINLTQLYPEFKANLKEHVVRKYRDLSLSFMFDTISQIDYFQDLKIRGDHQHPSSKHNQKRLSQEERDTKELHLHILYQIVFSLDLVLVEKDQTFLSTEDQAKSICFLEEGSLQICTEFEGHKFAIEVLGPGSVLNYRSFFMKDQMEVSVVALADSKIRTVKISTLKKIIAKYTDQIPFSTKLLMAQNKILKADTRFILDYIARDFRKCSVRQRSNRALIQQLKIKTALKNVVMRIVIEIRERKKKPKLREVLNLYKKTCSQDDKKAQKKFRDGLLKLYGGQPLVLPDGEAEKKYILMIELLKRIQKQIQQHHIVLNHLVGRINQLIERKERRLEALRAKKKSKRKKSGPQILIQEFSEQQANVPQIGLLSLQNKANSVKGRDSRSNKRLNPIQKGKDQQLSHFKKQASLLTSENSQSDFGGETGQKRDQQQNGQQQQLASHHHHYQNNHKHLVHKHHHHNHNHNHKEYNHRQLEQMNQHPSILNNKHPLTTGGNQRPSRNQMMAKSIGLLHTNVNDEDSDGSQQSDATNILVDPRQLAQARQEELNEIERQYMNLDEDVYDDDPNEVYARAERKGKAVNFDLMTSPFLIRPDTKENQEQQQNDDHQFEKVEESENLGEDQGEQSENTVDDYKQSEQLQENLDPDPDLQRQETTIKVVNDEEIDQQQMVMKSLVEDTEFQQLQSEGREHEDDLQLMESQQTISEDKQQKQLTTKEGQKRIENT